LARADPAFRRMMEGSVKTATISKAERQANRVRQTAPLLGFIRDGGVVDLKRGAAEWLDAKEAERSK
jgi:hypothetical protein